MDNVPLNDFSSRPARLRAILTSPTISLVAEVDKRTYFSLSVFLLNSFLLSMFGNNIEEISDKNKIETEEDVCYS